VCGASFTARRRDARYCSGKCRQRGTRARSKQVDWQRELDSIRALYWATLRQAAEARGVPRSQVVTEQAQFVDTDGNVFVGPLDGPKRFVGKTTPHRAGWSAWGLEAAGPPFSPPTSWCAEQAERNIPGAKRRNGRSDRFGEVDP
jgi:hypothetical protein